MPGLVRVHIGVAVFGNVVAVVVPLEGRREFAALLRQRLLCYCYAAMACCCSNSCISARMLTRAFMSVLTICVASRICCCCCCCCSCCSCCCCSSCCSFRVLVVLVVRGLVRWPLAVFVC